MTKADESALLVEVCNPLRTFESGVTFFVFELQEKSGHFVAETIIRSPSSQHGRPLAIDARAIM